MNHPQWNFTLALRNMFLRLFDNRNSNDQMLNLNSWIQIASTVIMKTMTVKFYL